LHNYHVAHKQFPIGQVVRIDEHRWQRWSWYYGLLPYVEQQALADVYQRHIKGPQSGGFSYTNCPQKEVAVGTFLCPSQSGQVKSTNGSDTTNQQGFHGNYVLNGGNTYFNPGSVAGSTSLNGLFMADYTTNIDQIRDGTSHTLLASEILLVPDGPVGSGQEDVRGRYHNVRHAGALFSTLYGPNTSQPDRFNYCLNTLKEAPCTGTGTDVVVSARSFHTGGVNASLADGSVRFVADDIDPVIYNALGTRAGGETISGNW
jgi:prepilin-type processing-associated H-X9-DG protein